METTKRKLCRLQARASISAQYKRRANTRLHTETPIRANDKYGEKLRLFRYNGRDRQGMGRVGIHLRYQVACFLILIHVSSIKESGVQWDERIIECNWDPEYDSWRFMRFRDDKSDGNHWSVVQKIIESIRDGVELETVRRQTDSSLVRDD